MAEAFSYPELNDIIITLEDVRKQLAGLNPYKTPGPDGISSSILKELGDQIAPSLMIIFQSSGIVPSDCKEAHVAIVFKKGQHDDFSNGPLSLIGIFCKILEHIIVSNPMNHLKTNSILCPQQHGFRRMRSCETQLLDFVEELSETMEHGNQTDIIILDFAKAFDKVNHSLLLHKLHRYGVRGRVNQGIQNFLEGRRQAVVVDDKRSNFTDVRSGAPQGSVLCPSMFLVFVNDLPEPLTSLSVSLLTTLQSTV